MDAQTFADWGVDTLKYDFCHVPKNMWHQGHILYNLGLFNFTDRESFGELGACMEFFDIVLTWDSGYGLRLTDMFTGEDMGLYTENINILLPPHDCRMYRAVLEHR